jgi:excisionase family DNA binding protein
MHAQGTAVSPEQGTAGSGSARVERVAYTVAEVATLLGKHINTVYRWVRSGVLPSERIGNTIYIPKWALARLISPDADHVLAAAANPTSLRMQPS